MSAKKLFLGVDIGGTFTDLVVLDSVSGRVAVGKVLTDYDDLAGAVLRGARDVLSNGALHGPQVARVIHGTTLVTNALIQRHGADTALIVTRGFRDILEMGRESRYDIYAIDIELPRPLVPRHLVFEVDERLDATGRVVRPLDEERVRSLAREIRQKGVTSVAICLLHAYRNDAHERRIAEIFHDEAPEIVVSPSSSVMPDIREYERACTTVANAFVQPPVREYVSRLSSELHQLDIAAPLLLMTSDGGTISAQAAVEHPIRLLESGPAGGAIAASFIGRKHGIERVLAYDMGGTTAKICLVDGSRPEHTDQFEFGRVYRFAKGSGLPLKVPAIEMIEIGAGGGSIAHVDAMGLLRVGPESAGASPGPACYALGGKRPTVTDADLYLGYLDAGSFLGGTMQLDRHAATAAIEQDVAKPLDLSTTRAAWGIYEIVNDNMARAAKIHCLERGKDPRDYTLVAYGGAGPVHAEQVARALGIRSIVYPLRAGVMSAFGFLVAPPSFELLRAIVTPLDEIDIREANALLRSMEKEGRALLKTAGVTAAECIVRREVGMRFHGQSFELSVPIRESLLQKRNLPELRRAFLGAYRERFHRLNPDVSLEAVNLRVVVSGKPQKIPVRAPFRNGRRAKKGERSVYVPQRNGFLRCAVYDRYALSPDAKLRGPAIVEEHESTVVLGVGAAATVARNGDLIVRLPS